MVEKSIHDTVFGKKMFDLIQKGKLDNIDYTKEIFNHIRSDINKVKGNIEDLIKQSNTKLQKYLENASKINEMQKNKNEIKIGQEYFTPIKEANELIKLSNIENRYKTYYSKFSHTLRILEPSAGHGSLILPLLNLIDTKQIKMKIDLVEFLPENRQILQSMCDKIPDVLNLEKTTDFLEFNNGEQYDFIFANPPFHLDHRINKKYKKDYYDYDFIKRAYGLLAENGIMVTIIGINCKKNKEIIEFF